MAWYRPAHFLAPLSLIAVGVGVVVIVKKETHHSSPPAQTTTVSRAPRRHTAPKRARTYVVREGDTLSEIAAHAKISLATLERLNPNVSATTVHPGQRLKLSR